MASEENKYEVITYEDEVTFSYTLEDGTQESVECELTFIWEDNLKKFIEKFGSDKEYTLKSFKFEQHYNFYVNQVESRIEDQLEEIEEGIANKSKYGFEFTGQLHNDD
ncbi:MAG: MoaD/ThiS family protein [Campylobacterales bacterium]|nr:MoaD/ThiS family protein [Campylobacterales bacterium]